MDDVGDLHAIRSGMTDNDDMSTNVYAPGIGYGTVDGCRGRAFRCKKRIVVWKVEGDVIGERGYPLSLTAARVPTSG